MWNGVSLVYFCPVEVLLPIFIILLAVLIDFSQFTLQVALTTSPWPFLFMTNGINTLVWALTTYLDLGKSFHLKEPHLLGDLSY